MSQSTGRSRAISLFDSYSHKDEGLRDELATHLSVLRRQGVIEQWHDRRIGAGKEWEQAIDEHLNTADIILLLVSPDFLASDYCYDVELRRAMERHEAGGARVIPIIIRPCDWHGAPFGKLNALPKDGKPIRKWKNRDDAWTEVAGGIRQVAEEITGAPPPTPLDVVTDADQEVDGRRVQTDEDLEALRQAALKPVQEWFFDRLQVSGSASIGMREKAGVDIIKRTTDGTRYDIVILPLPDHFRVTYRVMGNLATTPVNAQADETMYVVVARSLEDATVAVSMTKHKLYPFPGTREVIGFLDSHGIFVDIWEAAGEPKPELPDVLRVHGTKDEWEAEQQERIRMQHGATPDEMTEGQLADYLADIDVPDGDEEDEA